MKQIVPRMVQLTADDLFGSYEEMIDRLNSYKEKYGDFSISEEWSGYEDNWFQINYEELETDKEYNKRIEWEAEMKLQKEIDDEEKRVYELEKEEKRIADIKAQIESLQKQL